MRAIREGYDLTIWIPTYNRPKELKKTLLRIRELEIDKHVSIIISDNCSFSKDKSIDSLITSMKNIRLIKNTYNLSAGANFMRAFEVCSTTWIHILSDDDIIQNDYLDTIKDELDHAGRSTVAIKFDTELYGKQSHSVARDLEDVIPNIPKNEINDWFNNLLLISSWIFRRELYGNNIRSGYLGYGTKLSHILPTLSLSKIDNGQLIVFSSKQICHFQANDDSWPRAASWVEMCINTQIGHGYLSKRNKNALKHCLFSGNLLKLTAKILRIRAFYQYEVHGVNWIQILVIIGMLSKRFMVLSILLVPVLIFPKTLWSVHLMKKLGDEGSIERW